MAKTAAKQGIGQALDRSGCPSPAVIPTPKTSSSAPPRLALWFLAALAPMVAAQVLRLQQGEPLYWLLCDYAGRLAIIAVLASSTVVRATVLRREPGTLDAGQIAIWMILLLLFDLMFLRPVQAMLTYEVPVPRLGFYPRLQGALYWFDMTFGVMLTAISEELLFRRVARQATRPVLGDGWLMIGATSIAFGAFHWWTGLWNMLGAAVAGALLMALYCRAGVLWPVVTIHYILDCVYFG